MTRKNAFYAQSGGVTSVINASACGVIETARNHKDRIGRVYAGRNGIIGALTEDMIDTSREPARNIAALRHTPGGAFGSARYKLRGIEENLAKATERYPSQVIRLLIARAELTDQHDIELKKSLEVSKP